jgi:hypothetical protein
MKKRGSAIILAVLLLSFFTAIALAVFYLGGKKGERAYLKVQGEEVSNDIDMGATLGYYDAYISEQFVRKGKVYRTVTGSAHPDAEDSYPDMDDIKSRLGTSLDSLNYILENETPTSGDYYYTGIRLSSYINYFASNWDHTLGDAVKPYISRDTFNRTIDSSNPILAYRNWQEDEEKINRLWMYDGNSDDDDDNAVTVGGYRLEKLEIYKDDDYTDGVADGDWDSDEDLKEIYPLDEETNTIVTSTIKSTLDSKTGGSTERKVYDAWLVRATYSKRIRLSDSTVGEANFKLQAVHEAVIRFIDADDSGELEIDELTVDGGEVIEELIIEKM